MPTSAGCKALKDSIAPDDSYAVKKLKEEGAIILAKANMSEFASSGSNSRSTLGGAVHNAYDTERTAVMYKSFSPGETRRTLSSDDIAGIAAIYD